MAMHYQQPLTVINNPLDARTSTLSCNMVINAIMAARLAVNETANQYATPSGGYRGEHPVSTPDLFVGINSRCLDARAFVFDRIFSES